MKFVEEVEVERVVIHALPDSKNPKAIKAFRRFLFDVEILGLDVETTATDDDGPGVWDDDAQLRLVQLGSRTVAWVLDPSDPVWRKELHRAFTTGGIRFVSHTNYDVLWIKREFDCDLAYEGRSIDTMPMACLLFPGVTKPKTLKALTSEFIDPQLVDAETQMHERFRELAPPGHRVGKKLKQWGFTNIPLNDEEYLRYAGLDAIYVRRLLDLFNIMLKEQGMSKIGRTEQRIARLATGMQARGMLVDENYTRNVLGELENEYNTAEDFLQKTFDFSPRSPRRGDWLEERGVIFSARTATGKPKLDKDTLPKVLETYRQKHDPDDELASLNIEVMENMIALSSRQNLLNNIRGILSGMDSNGYIHPKINTQQAHTGRMSIVRPAMQTFKKTDTRLRGCFIAEPGHVFVGADYDSQEIRLAAAFSRDPALLKIVNENLNQHDLTAEMIFGENYSKAERHKAKILDFAQQYGAGPKTIARQLGISVMEAKKLWTDWRRAYSRLVLWSERCSEYPSITNPWGRVVPADPMRKYANGNYAIQSSGRDVLGQAMCKLADAGWSQFLWLPIHDELILHVPEANATEACAVLSRAMECDVMGVKLTASPEIIGTRWSGV